MSELKVGDRIYRIYAGKDIQEVITIDRVTKTQAISKDDKYRFRINLTSWGTADLIGVQERFARLSYQLETDQLKNQFEMQKLKTFLSRINFDNLTKQQMQQIKQIITQ